MTETETPAYGPIPEDKTVVYLTNNRSGNGFLRQALIEEYGLENIFMFGLPPDPETGEKIGSMEQLREVAPTGKYKLYFGHLPWGIHQLMPGPIDYAVTIRDPVERVLSLYDSTVVRLQKNPPALADWIGGMPDAVNGMVKRMCGIDFWEDKHDHYDFVGDRPLDADPEITESHLELAIERTKGDTVILPQARPGEKLALLRHRYDTAPLFSLFFHNIGTLSPAPRRESCSPEDLAVIEEHNQWDLEYYDWAMREFDNTLPPESTGFTEEARIMKLVCDVVRDIDCHQMNNERLHERLAAFTDAWQRMGKQRDLIEVLKRFTAKRNMNPAFLRSQEEMIGKLEAQLNS